MSDNNISEDTMRSVKSAFKAGLTVAVFIAPVLFVVALFRR